MRIETKPENKKNYKTFTHTQQILSASKKIVNTIHLTQKKKK